MAPAAGRDGRSGAGLGPLYRAALIQSQLGNRKAAEQIARARLKRYPHISSLALLARILWQHEAYDAAAHELTHWREGIRIDDWRWKVGKEAVAVFGEAPPARLTAAARALRKAGASGQELQQIATQLASEGYASHAFEINSDVKVRSLSDLDVLLECYGHLASIQSEETARAWLLSRLPQGLRPALAMMAYHNGHHELLWTLVDEPPPDRHGDYDWLLRAAAHVSRAEPSGEQRERLLVHYREPGASYYHTIGQYLMGLAEADAVVALAREADSATEAAFFLGVRAQAEGRFDDAVDWYRVTVELGQVKEGEYRWAHSRLYRWAGNGLTLERLKERWEQRRAAEQEPPPSATPL